MRIEIWSKPSLGISNRFAVSKIWMPRLSVEERGHALGMVEAGVGPTTGPHRTQIRLFQLSRQPYSISSVAIAKQAVWKIGRAQGDHVKWIRRITGTSRSSIRGIALSLPSELQLLWMKRTDVTSAHRRHAVVWLLQESFAEVQFRVLSWSPASGIKGWHGLNNVIDGPSRGVVVSSLQTSQDSSCQWLMVVVEFRGEEGRGTPGVQPMGLRCVDHAHSPKPWKLTIGDCGLCAIGFEGLGVQVEAGCARLWNSLQYSAWNKAFSERPAYQGCQVGGAWTGIL